MADLGVFGVTAALDCLSISNIVSTTAGYNVVSCLYNALGLQPYSGNTQPTVIDIPCPAGGGSSCTVELPNACKNLAGEVGLGIAVDVVLCTTSLGVFATGDVLTCLATDVITISTTGNSILGCVTNALIAKCPATLPTACSALSKDVGAVAIGADIVLCTAALGPFAAGNALTCLSTSGLNANSLGSTVVDCLKNALFALGSGSLPSVSLPSISGPSISLPSISASVSLSVPSISPSAVSSICHTTIAAAPSPTASVCFKSLPAACVLITPLVGNVAINAVKTPCLTSLGPYNNAAAAACFNNLGLLTSGSTVTSCLTTALTGKCITSLPSDCTSLTSSNGLDLVTKVPACVADLGVFGVTAALDCLSVSNIVSTTAGYNVVSCLYNALGLQPYSGNTQPIVLDIPCPIGGGGGSACAVDLPDACKNLAGGVGLGIAVDVALCTTKLGAFATGDVLTCLATDVITISTTGNSILGCITNALTAKCPTTLPTACSALSKDVGAVAIGADIVLCTAALGPFAAGSALTCLSTAGLNANSLGSTVVSCLTNALFGTGSGSLPSISLPSISLPSISASVSLPSVIPSSVIPSICHTTIAAAPSPTASVCFKSLPAACVLITPLVGNVAINAVKTPCLTSLGPYNNAAAAACFNNLGLLTSGSTVTSCLTTALTGKCITSLPSDCTSLTSSNGLDLVTKVPACVADLGVFGVTAALDCLSVSNIVSTTAGYNVVSCLYNALGLQPYSGNTQPIVLDIPCPIGGGSGSACTVNLPDACKNLAGEVGLGIAVDIALCTTKLGTFATGDVLTCLATDALTISTSGNSILGCVTNALTAKCPTALPTACSALSKDVGAVAIGADIVLCTAALGPFAAGNALTCLSTVGLNANSLGSTVVSCLTKALFDTGSGSLPSVSIPAVSVSAKVSASVVIPSVKPSSVVPSICHTTIAAAPSPTASVCFKSLPAACVLITPLVGNVAITAVKTPCLTSLGPYNNAAAAACFNNLGFLTSGSTVTSCLTTALTGKCITTLPSDCTSLTSSNGLDLVTKVPACVADLGVFGVTAALDCLSISNIVSTTAGYNVVSCLYNALGLQPYSGNTKPTVVEVPCPIAGVNTCSVDLPSACKNLAGEVGLGIAVDIALCTTKLGTFATGSVLTCLATDALTVTTSGNSIIGCVTNALSAKCPAALPTACSALSKDVGAVAIGADLVLCTAALGPYATGDALTCLSKTGLNANSLGSTVVTCLNKALSIGG